MKELAIKIFMGSTLNSLYPDHDEYPYMELKDIEKKHPEIELFSKEFFSLEDFKTYPSYVLECYFMKRCMEIYSENDQMF